MTTTKEQRFSIISTLLFLVALTGLLLFFGFTAPFPPPVEEGILINFGTTETGSGEIEPLVAEAIQELEEVPIPPKASITEPIKNDEKAEEVVTQDFEQTAVIEEKKRQEKKEKEALEQKKIEEEIARKQQEEIEKNKREEEERIQKEEQQLKSIKDRGKNAFAGKNPDGGTNGEGVNGGVGNQGDPNGDVNSKNRTGGPTGGDGVSFSLAGRSSKFLPKPEYLSKSEGKVVVEVTVDQDGNVIKATPGGKGTTTSDRTLHQAAEKAALKATFDVNKNAPPQQVGTITYFFILQ